MTFMFCSMSHKYKCNTIFFRCIQTVIAGILHRFCGNRLCNNCFICIDYSCIRSHLSKQWLCNFYSFKLIRICLYCFHQFVILCSMH